MGYEMNKKSVFALPATPGTASPKLSASCVAAPRVARQGEAWWAVLGSNQ